ncbi:phosphoribosyltransferase domain-containing protein [Mesorhizobium sp. AR07]|uniref:phosphoribosyltransferase domain-containing protein n=1 Tax=Mesorhizobium sp. AR07 TaxID=2865838 RepID=UPI00216080AD|nr:phosphoribosyltransferase domain-containing protein [Mesorhizobium sp. AR07]
MDNALKKYLSAELARGTISVEIDRSLMPPDATFGFAERINPKRSFLFASKLLGRHSPVRPSLMRKTYKLLADQISPDLEGPILFIGMAETAVGLGAGVHQQYSEQYDRHDTVYICTTRHALGLPLICEFQEEHSHAPEHLVHWPLVPVLVSMVKNARTLVLIDDEASTGKTFGNLFAALPASIRSNLRNTVLVTLTDWSDGAVEQIIAANVKRASILSGRYRWDANGLNIDAPEVPSVEKNRGKVISPDRDINLARLGVSRHHLQLDGEAASSGATLVLGTGENIWQPFLLAEKLELEGANVHYSSVTRSPISVGHAIVTKLAFEDNYGGHVFNYLYNVVPSEYVKILLCSETSEANISSKLMHFLERVSLVRPKRVPPH